ncbi:MAG: hypothetical protein AB7I04_24725 [Pseudomonadales bacterium]
MLGSIAGFIAESTLAEGVVHALGNVPGLPPLLQSLHILAIAGVVSAFVVPQLRIMGIAAHRQSYVEMLHRLTPWGGGALVVLLLTGAVFVIARPHRYLGNPLVGIKFAALAVALVLTWLLARSARRSAPLFSGRQRAVALLGVLAWLGVILAGRWIAYVDYLFWDE